MAVAHSLPMPDDRTTDRRHHPGDQRHDDQRAVSTLAVTPNTEVPAILTTLPMTPLVAERRKSTAAADHERSATWSRVP